MVTMISLPEASYTQDTSAVWGVWAGSAGTVEMRLCAQSDPSKPLADDFLAIYSTQDYEIELLDRGADNTWLPRYAPENVVTIEVHSDGSLRLESSHTDIWSGVVLKPVEQIDDTAPCASNAFNEARTFLPEQTVTYANLDGVSYQRLSITDPSGKGKITTFRLLEDDLGAATINTWLADVLPKTVHDAPYYSCSLYALESGRGSYSEHQLVPELITDQFVVVEETEDVFCGGLSPNYYVEWIVFDRSTGKTVDTTSWVREDAFYDLGPYRGQGPEVGDPDIMYGFRELMINAFSKEGTRPPCQILLDIVTTWNVRPSRDGVIFTPADDLGPGRGCATGLSFSLEEVTPYLTDAAIDSKLFQTE